MYDVELSRGTVSLTCLGEGGLSMDRIHKNPVFRYLDRLRSVQPSVLIINLGTNDLCSEKCMPPFVGWLGIFPYGMFMQRLFSCQFFLVLVV